MTSRAQHRTFVAAALALWLLFLVQALQTPILLDDWYELRYWRDHDVRADRALAATRTTTTSTTTRGSARCCCDRRRLARDPRDRRRRSCSCALVPLVFALAFARWPRREAARPRAADVDPGDDLARDPDPRDHVLLPAVRDELPVGVHDDARAVRAVSARAGRRLGTAARRWLVPIMLVLGWIAGMCNEHTGPTAMVAMAGARAGSRGGAADCARG